MRASLGETAGSAGRFSLARIWVLLFLLLELLVFSLLAPGFLRFETFQLILFYGTLVFLLATAELFVIVTGGGAIDLSVGYLVGFASVVSSKLMAALVAAGWPPLGAIGAAAAATLAIGLLPGLVNGLLVAYLKVPPFIATFSMLGAAHGVSLLLTKGVYITDVPQLAGDIGSGHLLYLAPGGLVSWFRPPQVPRGTAVTAVLPTIVVFAFAFIAAFAFLLKRTRFGRHLYAIGGSRDAALRAGIDLRRRLVSVYMLSSFLASLGGIIYVLMYVSGKSDAGSSLLIEAIAAVVLGGASMFGGSGSVWRTILGCLVIAVLETGLRIAAVPTFYTYILVGAILILAVVLEKLMPDRAR